MNHDEIVIKADKLTKKFGDFTAVNQISFNVYKGEIFGFLGANGAGKTTAIRMLTALSKPSGGQAEVAGMNIYKKAEKIKKRIGYMCQKFSLYDDLTIIENIEFYGAVYGLSKKKIKEKSEALLKKLGLEGQREKLIGSLPLGWKQKLAFSISLIHDPAIVFLDEPTGGVDPITRRQFWDMIYEAAAAGTTVFVTTHYMDEAEYCDRISIMVDGKIEALDTPKNLKKAFAAEDMNSVFVKLARPAQNGGEA